MKTRRESIKAIIAGMLVFVARPLSQLERRSEFLKRRTMPPALKMDNFGISADAVRKQTDGMAKRRR
jgi:hypothetical protein